MRNIAHSISVLLLGYLVFDERFLDSSCVILIYLLAIRHQYM